METNMNTMASALRASTRSASTVSRTENGMKSFSTTKSALVDLFGKIGSARGQDVSDLFNAAFAENSELATRILLWARDVRQGAGERKTFRDLARLLDKTDPVLGAAIMHMIPALGRWDDVLEVYDAQSPNRARALDMIGVALRSGDGLCAKWMPRKGMVAVELRRHLDMSPKQWRKTLVELTSVVETQMCAKQWNEINFSHVPSVAASRYQKAFWRNAEETYSKYVAELQKPVEKRDPKVKINAGAVFPYDIVKSVRRGDKNVADAQWDALPNLIGDVSIFPMVDVSGSMNVPIQSERETGGLRKSMVSNMDVAISLGLYTSMKNTGPFKDAFMTFSHSPQVQYLSGTLSERINQMERANWSMNTDLNKAMEKFLDIAVSGNVAPEDMPRILLIISDMQFDSCMHYDDSALQMIRRKFVDAGYEIPDVVFWNLEARTRENPVQIHNNGTAMISGFSPSIMKSVLSAKNVTPYDIMMETIGKDRYDFRLQRVA